MPRRGRHLHVVLLLAAMTLSTSCRQVMRAAGGPEPEVVDVDADDAHVLLKVENNNWSDVVVSVEHDGRANRIATVKGATTAELHVQRAWMIHTSTVRLVAHRIGTTTSFRSEGFVVPRGSSVLWTLETDLARSSLAIW